MARLGDRRTRARLLSASRHNDIAGPWWKTAPTRFRSPMPTSYQTEDSTKPWCLWSRSAGSVRLWSVVLMRGSLAADCCLKKLGWGSSAESRGRSTAWFARVSAAPQLTRLPVPGMQSSRRCDCLGMHQSGYLACVIVRRIVGIGLYLRISPKTGHPWDRAPLGQQQRTTSHDTDPSQIDPNWIARIICEAGSIRISTPPGCGKLHTPCQVRKPTQIADNYLLTKLERGCIGTISRQPYSSQAAWASASYTGRTAQTSQSGGWLIGSSTQHAE